MTTHSFAKRVASPTGFNRHALEYRPNPADNLQKADASWGMTSLANALYRNYPDMARRTTFDNLYEERRPLNAVAEVEIAQEADDTLHLQARTLDGAQASLGKIHLRTNDLSESSKITMRNLLSHLTESWFNSLLGEVERQRKAAPAPVAEVATEKPLNLRPRPAATAEMHSEAWFNDAFSNAHGIPPRLRHASEQIVKVYDIRGTADPGYIANVIALELEIGDGQNNFRDTQPDLHGGLRSAAIRIATSYGCNIPPEARPEIEAIIAKAFNPVYQTP